jgi:hypothetical protein
MKAGCFYCFTEREILDPQEVILMDGRKAIKGKCPVCKRNICKILKDKKGE